MSAIAVFLACLAALMAHEAVNATTHVRRAVLALVGLVWLLVADIMTRHGW